MQTRHKLGITLLAGLLGLCVAEAALRLTQTHPILPPTEEGLLTAPSPDPELRHENVPGARQRRTFRSRYPNVREVEAFVNAQGFRGSEVALPKPDGLFRVACLGDSQTFGDGVGEQDTWPVALERALRDVPIDVINAGVPGYDTEQEVLFVEKRLAAYELDLVVLGFFVNDTALPGTMEGFERGTLSHAVHFFSPGRDGLFNTLRQRSRLLDLGGDWMFRTLAERDWLDGLDPLFAPDFSGWTRVQTAIRRGRDIVERRGGRFVVLLVPLLMTADGELASSAPYRVVSEFCRAESIACYDAEPLYAGLDVDRMRVDRRDPHTGGEGNRILGEGFARWLRETGLVPAASSR